MAQRGNDRTRWEVQRLTRASAATLGALLFLVGSSAAEATARSCGPTAGCIDGIVCLDGNNRGDRQVSEEGTNGVVPRITGWSASSQLRTPDAVRSTPGSYSTGPTICEAGDSPVEIVSAPLGYAVSGPLSPIVTTGLAA